MIFLILTILQKLYKRPATAFSNEPLAFIFSSTMKKGEVAATALLPLAPARLQWSYATPLQGLRTRLYGASSSIVLLLEKYYLGAFSAAPKTGLCGGSAACAAAPRPSNPLRSCGIRPAATACPQAPQGVSIIRMIDILVTDFDLILLG
jgi:hypothetical protein